MKEFKFLIGNNTDLHEHPAKLTSRREAERMWKHVRPGPAAGNAYVAWFLEKCDVCGEWQDATAPYATCRCAR